MPDELAIAPAANAKVEEAEAPKYMSAKASRPDGAALTEAELEAAEEEARLWARKCSCS